MDRDGFWKGSARALYGQQPCWNTCLIILYVLEILESVCCELSLVCDFGASVTSDLVKAGSSMFKLQRSARAIRYCPTQTNEP